MNSPTDQAQSSSPPAGLPADLLQILVCPLTRSPLRRDGQFLVSEIGGLCYPIRDGIPVLLIEEASLPEGFDSLEAFKQHHRDRIPAPEFEQPSSS